MLKLYSISSLQKAWIIKKNPKIIEDNFTGIKENYQSSDESLLSQALKNGLLCQLELTKFMFYI